MLALNQSLICQGYIIILDFAQVKIVFFVCEN